MFNNVLKEWQEKGEKRSTFIGLYKNTVHVVYSNKLDESIIYSYEAFLLLPEVICSLALHSEVIFELLQRVEAAALSGEAYKVFQFYKALSPNVILSDSIEIPDTNFTADFTPSGLRQFQKKEANFISTKEQLLHRFFFYGPSFSGIPLNKRKAWKANILAALAKDAAITYRDSFLLFDYDKIQPKTYTHHDPLQDAGSYVTLNKSYLLIGSWHGNQERAEFYSIEECWNFAERLLKDWDKGLVTEIREILELAIIPESSSDA